MNEKEFDQYMKDQLREHTDEMAVEKKRIKNELEQILFKQGVSRMETKQKKGKKTWKKTVALLTSVAAILIIGLALQTNAGYAFVDKIKAFFEPEKEITQSLEGQEEKTQVELNESKKAEYVIYVDTERYRFIEGQLEEPDKIVTKEPLEERYPEVSMEIKQELSLTKEEAISQIINELGANGFEVVINEKVTSPQIGQMIYAVADLNRKWDTPVQKYYVIDVGEKGVFIFKEKFFVEAEEGHGARFDAMIKEFYLKEE